jgi:hypothetical protein
MSPSSPKERPYPGKQLGDGKRLDRVIVRTGIKTANYIMISGAAGYHNHSHISSFSRPRNRRHTSIPHISVNV